MKPISEIVDAKMYRVWEQHALEIPNIKNLNLKKPLFNEFLDEAVPLANKWLMENGHPTRSKGYYASAIRRVCKTDQDIHAFMWKCRRSKEKYVKVFLGSIKTRKV